MKIDSVSWGNIVVNGQKFGQVIITGDRVRERGREKLEKLFGATHVVGDWEVEELLSENPQIIIIGTGQFGVLKVSDEIKEKLTRSGAEIKVLLTPAAVAEFNRKINEGKNVNALIHTTC